jgi:hypothetical protein
VPLRLIVWLCLTELLGSPLRAFQGSPQEDQKLPLKTSLMQVIAGSHERFRPIMSRRIELFRDLYWYDVKHKLEGAQICRILEYPAAVFICDWDQRTTVKGLSGEIESALGSDWRRKEVGRYRDILRFKHQAKPGDHPTIEIMELQDGVRLTMFAPEREKGLASRRWQAPQ